MAVILTVTGQNKFAAALGGGDPVTFTDFAVGDGGGDYYTLDENQTALVNETWRGDVNRVDVDITNLDQVIVETLIPAGVGGWTIREAGLFDAVGDLIAIASYPLTEKPAPGSGSEKEIYARIVLQITNGGSAVIEISPDLTMATLQDMADHEAKQLDPADTDTVKEKHLSNAQANGWEAAIAANAQTIANEAAARSAADIESGTVMVFGQNSPPTGWTRKTDWQDNAMLCFAGTGDIGNGGSANPQSAHAHTGPSHTHTMGSHTHTGPSHTHNMGSHYHAGPNHYHGTGGHTLSIAEMPAHSHDIDRGVWGGGSSDVSIGDSQSPTYTTTIAGGGGSHSHGNTGYGGTGATGGPSTNTTGAAGTGATGGPSTNTTAASGTGSTGANSAPYYQEVIAATKD